MSRFIEIVISPQGEARVETKGFAGSSCRDASKFVEQALGQAAGERLTGEFFAQQVQQRSLHHGAES